MMYIVIKLLGFLFLKFRPSGNAGNKGVNNRKLPKQ